MRARLPARGDQIAWEYPDGVVLEGVITRITKDSIYVVKVHESLAALVWPHHITDIVHRAIGY